jgi:hypothetical protein
MEARRYSSKHGAIMKELFAIVVLTGCLAVASFAGDVVQSVTVAGKGESRNPDSEGPCKSSGSWRQVSLLTDD